MRPNNSILLAAAFLIVGKLPAHATTYFDLAQFDPAGPTYLIIDNFIPERAPSLPNYGYTLGGLLPPPVTYDIKLTVNHPLLSATWDTGYYLYRNTFYADNDGKLIYDYGVDYFEHYPECVYGPCNPANVNGNVVTFSVTDTPTYTFYAGDATIRWTRASEFVAVIDPAYADTFSYTWAISSPVPEPMTWALFIFGFFAVGAELRRRSRRSSALLVPGIATPVNRGA